MEIKVWNVRIEKGYTIVQLAALSGISKSTIDNIENGVTCPTILQLEKLAKALDVRINDLFESDYK